MASALGKKSNVRLVGLDLIRVSNVVGATGWMPGTASLVTIGNVVPDSAHLIITAPTQTELFIEEEDTPDLVLNNTGMKLSLEFALRDMGRTTLAFGLGGTAGTTTVWNAPTTAYPIRERAVEVTSKTINGKKLKFEIPRAAMNVGGDLKFARTDTGTLTFSFAVMQPNSGVQITPCKITQV
jgi:hypothetical protein